MTLFDDERIPHISLNAVCTMPQERLAQFFVEWFQICGATALHLNVVPVFSHGFDIDIFVQLGIPGACNPRVTLAVDLDGRTLVGLPFLLRDIHEPTT